MIRTQQATDGFIFAEQPLISGKCPICQQSIKETIDGADKPIRLSFPYQIRTIENHGGRTFEKVSESYLHVHQPQTVLPQDSIRRIPINQSALL